MRWVPLFVLLAMTACGSDEAVTAAYDAPRAPDPDPNASSSSPTAPEVAVPELVVSPSKPLSVLFIGNSYTYVNDVPGLLAKISKTSSSGPMIETQVIAHGGATLGGHLKDPEVSERIAEATWTHVVLQGQSLDFAPAEAAKALGEMVLEAGAIPTWFVTWARAADSGEYSFLFSPDSYSSASEMQDFATYSYVQAAEQTPGSLLACVGEAFRQSLTLHPEIELHQDDASHATLAGAYLAASTFYVALTGSPVPPESFLAEGLTPTDATALRSAALVGSDCSQVQTRASIHADFTWVDFGVAGAPIPVVLTLENQGSQPGFTYGSELSAPFQWTNGEFPGGAHYVDAPGLTFCKSDGYFWEVPASSACLVSVTFDATSTASSLLGFGLMNDYRPEIPVGLFGTVGSTDRAVLSLCEDTGYLGCSNGSASSTFWPGQDATLVVTNRGGAATTSLVPEALAVPFSWQNGAFPGGTGVGKPNRPQSVAGEYRDPEQTYPYCGAVLAAGAQCIVTLELEALAVSDKLTPHSTTLSLAYSDALGPAAAKATRKVTKFLPPSPGR